MMQADNFLQIIRNTPDEPRVLNWVLPDKQTGQFDYIVKRVLDEEAAEQNGKYSSPLFPHHNKGEPTMPELPEYDLSRVLSALERVVNRLESQTVQDRWIGTERTCVCTCRLGPANPVTTTPYECCVHELEATKLRAEGRLQGAIAGAAVGVAAGISSKPSGQPRQIDWAERERINWARQHGSTTPDVNHLANLIFAIADLRRLSQQLGSRLFDMQNKAQQAYEYVKYYEDVMSESGLVPGSYGRIVSLRHPTYLVGDEMSMMEIYQKYNSDLNEAHVEQSKTIKQMVNLDSVISSMDNDIIVLKAKLVFISTAD